MARSIRASSLETRTARLKLPIRWKPYTARIAPGVRLGYRRNETAGSWNVIVANGQGGAWMKAFAVADDHEDANGDGVLDFWQAQERARSLARGGNADSKPVTVGEALDSYEADLTMRSADIAIVARVRVHLTDALSNKTVVLLTARELRAWRDGLKLKARKAKKRKKGAGERKPKKLTAASINRIITGLRGALNLAADADERISNRRAWGVGLKAIPDATESRNVVLTTQAIQDIVAAAYAIGEEFGTLVEIAAVTGARPVSQVGRLEASDVQADRLMMPSSKKGRGTKKITRRPVPIPASLAVRLHALANRRHNQPTAPLLTKPGGEPWKKSDHTRLFRRAVEAAGLNPAEVTIYSLRHSSIVRQLLDNVPVRLVAAGHDTSIAMIEKTYAKYINEDFAKANRVNGRDRAARAIPRKLPRSKGAKSGCLTNAARHLPT